MGAKVSRNDPRYEFARKNLNIGPNQNFNPINGIPRNNDFVGFAHSSRFDAMQNRMQQNNQNMDTHVVNGSTSRTPLNMLNKAEASNTKNEMGYRNNFYNDEYPQRMYRSFRVKSEPRISSSSSKKEPPSKTTLLQELLECPICMNLYEEPCVLPCQHTFCKKCLLPLQNNESNLLDCPLCRTKHRLPNGIEGLAANYTMKRLIELDALAYEKEKAMKEKANKEKAKCFVCQKFACLKVCSDCSYMLCADCIEDPNHDIIIESKVLSRKMSASVNPKSFDKVLKTQKYGQKTYSYDRPDIYSSGDALRNDDKLKLVLLCHSSIVELNQKKKNSNGNEVYEDEHGKCKTFSKIAISMNDRVISLKKIVENKFGISCKDQILVYKDQILKSDLKLLHSFNIRQYSRIHIFDERDVKENAIDIEEDIYGIYQDAELFQNNDTTQSKEETRENRENLLKNKSPSKALLNDVEEAGSKKSSITSSSSSSASSSSPTESSSDYEPKQTYSRNRNFKTVYRSAGRLDKIDNYERRLGEYDDFVHYKPAMQNKQTFNNAKAKRSSVIYGSKRQFNPAYGDPSRFRRLDEIFDRL